VYLLALELQSVPPAPGRGEVSQPSQPPPGAPPPASGQGQGGGGFGGMGMMLLMFVPMLLIIFLMNRSQSKKQKELEGKLKRGDRVLTASGLVGKIAEMGTRYVKIEVAPGVKVQMLKTSIQGLDSGEEPAAATKDADKAKGDGSDKDAPSDKK
jgi:preprotein translocase subunit YajC